MERNVQDGRITLAHGGGGRLTDRLIRQTILKHLPGQSTLTDSAVMARPRGRLAFTTDSYVVSPLFFPGADVGKLAVCGTVNDLAMVGAKPLALSLALIIEEGLELSVLDRVLGSIADTCRQADVTVVTGDTKVVPRGQADGLYINTAGVGQVHADADLGFDRIQTGDRILLTGAIGDHGLAVMAKRENLDFDTPITSDVAPLADLAGELIGTLGPAVRFMRDPTRGGLSTVLVDITDATGRALTVEQDLIPVHPPVRAAGDILGLDVLDVANEGTLVAVVDADAADQALTICRKHRNGSEASLIGTIEKFEVAGRVVMVTSVGGQRMIQKPWGEQLPRIC